MFDDADLEIFTAFVEECREMIDDVEPQLVELEQGQDEAGNVDPEMVNGIFRLFHSIKGSAGFLELKNIVALTHKAENLLDIFRKEQAKLEGPDITLLLHSLDLLRKVMEDLEESGHDNAFADEVGVQVGMLQESITRKLQPEISLEITPAKAPAPEPETAPAEPKYPSIKVTPEMNARFMEEAEELLDSAEQNLLAALDTEGGDHDLSEALRCLHSFKGNSGFMGYADLEKLTHRTETVLELVVAKQIKADQGALETFLEVVDITRKAVGDLANDLDGSIGTLSLILDRLDGLAAGAESESETPPAKGVKSGFIPLGNMNVKKKSPKLEPDQPVALNKDPEPTPFAAVAGPKAKSPAVATPAAAKAASPGSKAGGSIRVDLIKLDSLMNLVGELVIAEAMVTRNPDLDGHEFENLERASHHLRRITSDLQDVAMSVRMVPLSGTFKKMVRLVHDTGLKAGKKVELELFGEETEVDKTVMEQISDPLVHIVRNAIDHGLENKEERALTDKPEAGKVSIAARHESK